MADIMKQLNARLSLKYDLYTNWSTNNPVLLKGEVAFAYIPADSSLTVGNAAVNGTTPPNVMIKVGDGVNHYNDLKFVSGLAADVAGWAKAAVKPVYTADEIEGLESFIAGEIQDTDTQYKLVKVTDYQYKLMSKALGEADFTTEVSVLDIPKYDDTALAGRVGDVESAITTLNGDATVTGSVAKTVADAIAALKLAETYAAKTHTHTKSEITDFAHTHEMGEVNGLVDALAGKEESGAAAAALTEAKTYAEGQASAAQAAAEATAAADATSKANAAQAAAEATAAADATSKANAAQAAAEATAAADATAKADAALASAKTYAEGQASDALAAAKEYADGKDDAIAAAKQAADDAQDDVDALAQLVGTLPEGTDAETVVAYIDAKTANIASDETVGAIDERLTTAEAGLKAVQDDYLKGADKTELQGNINTVSKAVEDEVTRATTKEGEIETALNNYKTANDERVAAVEGEVDALQIQIGGLTGAMHFVGKVETDPATLTSGYGAGDVVLFNGKEYVFEVTDAEAGTGVFHELGDEGSHITKTEVANTYETKADAAAKLTEAKGYADTQDAATLAAAKEDATSKANAAQAAAEATAAADATAKANAAQAAAEATAAADATAKADAALAAAKEDATTKADAALASAKTYAEGQASDALAAAKEDATSKANAAQAAAEATAAADATAKADAALASAKEDATTKADAALASAKEDATSKANAAQAAAEATAAADATAKADAALASAKEYADSKDTAMNARVEVLEAKPAMGLTAENIADYNEAVTLADTAVQTVTAPAVANGDTTVPSGLKVNRTGNDVTIALDDTVTFVFNCGDSNF